MQLDSEPEENQSCPGDAHLSEGIGYNNSHLEKETLKDDNEVNRGGSRGFTSSEQVADPPLPGDKPGPFAYTYVEDSTNGNQNNGGHKTAPYSFSLPHFEKFGKEAEFSLNKAVTGIELPKMIVCYKEGSYHIIKDIRIDEGIHSFDKPLVENGAGDEKCCNISQIDRDEYTSELHISDTLKSSSLIGQPISDVKEDMKQSSFRNLLDECQDRSDTLDGTVSNEANEKKINERTSPPQDSDMQFQGCTRDTRNENLKQRSLASLLEEDRFMSDIAGEIVHASETEGLPTVREFDIGHCHFASSSSGFNLDQLNVIKNDTDQPQSINGDCEQPQCESHRLQCVRCECIKLPSAVGNTDKLHSVCDSSNEEQAHKCALEESNSTASDAGYEEPKGGNSAKNLSVTGKSVSSIIAFDIVSELPATNPKKDIEGVSEFRQSDLATCGTALEDASTDGPGASAQTSLNYPGHSDSNFLGPVSLSARIAYVGQIPYSGSISLRSDCSSTSTCSFAFPMLQSEWNSSPVKMARADRRHLKKHRFWRPRLRCFRF